MAGGNTDNVYNSGDHRRAFAESLEAQHPDVVKVVWKFNRWHHEVDYRPFKANKLIQIACGVAYGTGGEMVVIPSKPRMDVLKEIIEESEGKVIVFVPLTGALESVASELRKDWTVETVYGGTSKSERDRIFSEFQRNADPRVLVANASTMSHGLTLTAASTIVWYAPVHSNETYEQACARVRRPGQTRTTVIVHIAGTDVERRVYKRLQDKQSMQGVLLDMMKERIDQ
jgi:SNF2 family DNA or RNA helicase